MNRKELLDKLQGLHIPEIRFFDSIGSTNEEALKWAAEGASDNSLVIANRQTAGRGRGRRHWITASGSSLAFSLILKPDKKEMLNLLLFSPLGALAVSEAAEFFCHLPVYIKWPNDILLNRKKFAGILAESCWTGSELLSLVLGVGVNIAPKSVPKSRKLLFPATCLETACRKKLDRLDVLKIILEKFFTLRKELATPAFHNAWQERLAFKGEDVYIYDSKHNPQEGKLIGINRQGHLLLQNKNGQKMYFPIGDLHLRPSKH